MFHICDFSSVYHKLCCIATKQISLEYGYLLRLNMDSRLLSTIGLGKGVGSALNLL